MYKATITIMLRTSILDTQGKATQHALASLGFNEISAVRIGKEIVLELDATSKEAAKTVVENACKKLLANPVMEDYHYHIEELEQVAL